MRHQSRFFTATRARVEFVDSEAYVRSVGVGGSWWDPTKERNTGHIAKRGIKEKRGDLYCLEFPPLLQN